MKEVHHIHKLDAPSGTAISLAEQIIEEHGQINRWKLEKGPDSDTLYIEALREGEVKGIHTVRYESDVDFLSLSHEAKSRDAFVAGVLMAAQFIHGKKGIYGMNDLLNL